MKIKSLVGMTLTALLFAGCASEKHEAAEQAELMSKAKISQADAQAKASARVPNGTIKESEIEKEHGKLIWSFDMATPDSTDITEVNVDAMTGDIVSVEKEKPEKD